MATQQKKKPKLLKMPKSKNKKSSPKGNSYEDLTKNPLTDKEIGKLLGSRK